MSCRHGRREVPRPAIGHQAGSRSKSFFIFADLASTIAIVDSRRRGCRGQLVAVGLSYALAEALVELLEEDCFEKVPSVASPFEVAEGLTISGLKWVIKNDDLDLLDCASKGFLAGTGMYAATSGSAFATAIAGGIAAVFKVCRQAIRKGAFLDPLQFKALAILKRVGPCEIEQLVTELNAVRSEDEEPWQAETATSELVRLSKTRLSDGSLARLVDQDGEGRWSVASL
jgi:hypothetical protein